MYSHDECELSINKYFSYINVPHEMVYLKIDGINPIMDYLELLDINPDCEYKDPFSSGLCTLNLKYMDLLFRCMMVVTEFVYMINAYPLTNLCYIDEI